MLNHECLRANFSFRVAVLLRLRGAAMHIFTTEAREDGNAESHTTDQFFRKANLIHYTIHRNFCPWIKMIFGSGSIFSQISPICWMHCNLKFRMPNVPRNLTNLILLKYILILALLLTTQFSCMVRDPLKKNSRSTRGEALSGGDLDGETVRLEFHFFRDNKIALSEFQFKLKSGSMPLAASPTQNIAAVGRIATIADFLRIKGDQDICTLSAVRHGQFYIDLDEVNIEKLLTEFGAVGYFCSQPGKGLTFANLISNNANDRDGILFRQGWESLGIALTDQEIVTSLHLLGRSSHTTTQNSNNYNNNNKNNTTTNNSTRENVNEHGKELSRARSDARNDSEINSKNQSSKNSSDTDSSRQSSSTDTSSNSSDSSESSEESSSISQSENRLSGNETDLMNGEIDRRTVTSSPISISALNAIKDGTILNSGTRLGKGGLGEVSKVTLDAVEVAVKVNTKKVGLSPKAIRQWSEDIKTSIALQNVPGLAHVIASAINNDGQIVTVMMLGGKDLGKSIQNAAENPQSAPPLDSTKIGTRTLETLTKMHELGYAHVDFKPENVVLDPNDNSSPLVIDFDAALKLPGQGQTYQGKVATTPGYESPYHEASWTDGIAMHSDIFAWGMTVAAIELGGASNVKKALLPGKNIFPGNARLLINRNFFDSNLAKNLRIAFEAKSGQTALSPIQKAALLAITPITGTDNQGKSPTKDQIVALTARIKSILNGS